MNNTHLLLSFLEKMNSHDKDYRYMATNDLMNELNKVEFKLDGELENKIVVKIVKLLDDPNGEVQNLAMKCISPLSKKLKDSSILLLVDSLCDYATSQNESLRDISIASLKTVFEEISPTASVAPQICNKISARIIPQLTMEPVETVLLDSLDILGEALRKFGNLVPNILQLQDVLLGFLNHPRLGVRKRAVYSLGHLVAFANDSVVSFVVSHILEQLQERSKSEDARIFLSCLGFLTRFVAVAIGRHLETIFPIIWKCLQIDDDELRETALQTLEIFVLRCPKEVKPFVDSITNICFEMIKYDPNYNYDDSEGDCDSVSEMETEEDGFQCSDDDAYSDDDDLSWKVRRAAAKCISSIVNGKPDFVGSSFSRFSRVLISRFKEREESVQLEILNAYQNLLRQCKFIAAVGEETDKNRLCSSHIAEKIGDEVPMLLRALRKQLKQKSVKVRQNCLITIRELVCVVPAALQNRLDDICPFIIACYLDKSGNTNLRIEVLVLLSSVCGCARMDDMSLARVQDFTKTALAAVNDPFYKLSAEGLNLCTVLIKVLRPSYVEFPAVEVRNLLSTIYNAILPKLSSSDIDQEVKEKAILCVCTILSVFGDVLSAELSHCLPILVERLRNESTRISTLKGILILLKSPLQFSIDAALSDIVGELADYLRKSSRPARLLSLSALDIIVGRYGQVSSFRSKQISRIAVELPPLISETDLHISQLSLSLMSSIIRCHPQSACDFIEGGPNPWLPHLKTLVWSSFIQGIALDCLLNVFSDLLEYSQNVRCSTSLEFGNLIQSLMEPVYVVSKVESAKVSKQSYFPLSRLIAHLVFKKPDEGTLIISNLIQEVQNTQSNEAVMLLSLLALGNIGKHTNLSGCRGIFDTLMTAFESPSEDVKSAASFALGNVCTGNLSEFLPILVNEIKGQAKRQYLLLHALKEVIATESLSGERICEFEKFIFPVWELLFERCESKEEGTRNVVAECLGRLTLMKPEYLLKELQDRISSPSPFTRGIVATAIKFTIAEKPQLIDTYLKKTLLPFLLLVQDSDLTVKRLALIAFNAAAHNKPILVRELLSTYLPLVYRETKVKKELIRQVQMGPFTHVVDDGLEIRKAAFESLYTLLDSCMDCIDIFEYMNHIQDGLSDHYDVKLLTHIIIVRLCGMSPHAVLQRIDSIIPALEATLTCEVKPNAVKQETDKNEELIRSALRVTNALCKLQDSDSNPNFVKFCACIRNHPSLNLKMECIRKDELQRIHKDMIDL